MVSTNIQSNIAGQSAIRYRVLLLGAVSGFSLQLAGATVFVADLLVPVLLLMSFAARPDNRLTEGMALCTLIGGVFVALFILGDLVNKIGVLDLMRGGFRNVIFICYILAAMRLSFLLGPIFAYQLFAVMSGSYSLCMYFGFGPSSLIIWNGLSDHLKFHGLLQFIVIGLLTILGRRVFLASIALCGLGFWVLQVADYRLGAVLCVAPIALWITRQIKKARLPSWAMNIAMLLSIVTVALFANDYFVTEEHSDQSRIERREMSNRIRAEMIEYSFNQFIDKPILGHGSWTHVKGFSSSYDSNIISGVHNMGLQYANEYGSVGLAFIGLVTIIAIVGFYRWLEWWVKKPSGTDCNDLIAGFGWSFLFAQIAFGGLLGYGRIVIGLLVGHALYAVLFTLPVRDKRSFRSPAPVRPIPRFVK